jgi:hypothetical protein
MPLPYSFWKTGGFVIGIIELGYDYGAVLITSVNPGLNYIVFGTSSDDTLGYWTELYVTITTAAKITKIETTKRVHRNQYGYIVFDITSDGRITKISDGTVPPDTAPELPSPPSSGGRGGQTTGGGDTLPVDVGAIIKQMMENMIPPMMKMMGMMMVMQMMTGMISSLAGAFAV